MKEPLNTIETNQAITKAMGTLLSNLQEQVNRGNIFVTLREEITNVSLKAMVETYRRLPDDQKSILMPGEIDDNKMFICYKPTRGIAVWLESEPLKKVKCCLINREN